MLHCRYPPEDTPFRVTHLCSYWHRPTLTAAAAVVVVATQVHFESSNSASNCKAASFHNIGNRLRKNSSLADPLWPSTDTLDHISNGCVANINDTHSVRYPRAFKCCDNGNPSLVSACQQQLTSSIPRALVDSANRHMLLPVPQGCKPIMTMWTGRGSHCWGGGGYFRDHGNTHRSDRERDV